MNKLKQRILFIVFFMSFLGFLSFKSFAVSEGIDSKSKEVVKHLKPKVIKLTSHFGERLSGASTQNMKFHYPPPIEGEDPFYPRPYGMEIEIFLPDPLGPEVISETAFDLSF